MQYLIVYQKKKKRTLEIALRWKKLLLTLAFLNFKFLKFIYLFVKVFSLCFRSERAQFVSFLVNSEEPNNVLATVICFFDLLNCKKP